jgi:antitoxin VapB
MTGKTKEAAVREALREKKERLAVSMGKRSKGKEKPASMQEWLETEIWPRIPEEERGKPLAKEEVEDILGFGPEGV